MCGKWYLIDKRGRSEAFVRRRLFGFILYYTFSKKYKENKKKLCIVFIDIEKTYNRVPKDILKWALMRKWLPKRLEEWSETLGED